MKQFFAVAASLVVLSVATAGAADPAATTGVDAVMKMQPPEGASAQADVKVQGQDVPADLAAGTGADVKTQAKTDTPAPHSAAPGGKAVKPDIAVSEKNTTEQKKMPNVAKLFNKSPGSGAQLKGQPVKPAKPQKP